MVLRAALVILSLMVVGCQTASGVREPVWPYPQAPSPGPAYEPEPVPAPPGEAQAPTALPPYGLPQTPEWPKTAAEVSGPAVRGLMEQADVSRAAGRLDEAAANLERAVRIEPRNAFVWARLAEYHLDHGNFEQAEAMAQRSNSLSRGNPHVQMQNWRVIAAARNGRGDATGGLQAEARVEELRAGLPPE